MLRAAQRRQRFDTVVHLGELGGARVSCPVPYADPLLDAGTRTELVTRLLETGEDVPRAASVWLTRAGEPLLQDDDLAWLGAACRAFDTIGCRLTGFWSVTRTGWLDVRTGEQRTWKRLRL